MIRRSISSLNVWISLCICSGHLSLLSPSHSGPCFHSKLSISWSGWQPLEIKSAGFSRPETCLHMASLMFWISATRLAINVFQVLGSALSQSNTTVESIQKWFAANRVFNAVWTFSYKRAPSNAAHNSNLGIGTTFRGATLDLDAWFRLVNLLEYFHLLILIGRRYMPHMRLLMRPWRNVALLVDTLAQMRTAECEMIQSLVAAHKHHAIRGVLLQELLHPSLAFSSKAIAQHLSLHDDGRYQT